MKQYSLFLAVALSGAAVANLLLPAQAGEKVRISDDEDSVSTNSVPELDGKPRRDPGTEWLPGSESLGNARPGFSGPRSTQQSNPLSSRERELLDQRRNWIFQTPEDGGGFSRNAKTPLSLEGGDWQGSMSETPESSSVARFLNSSPKAASPFQSGKSRLNAGPSSLTRDTQPNEYGLDGSAAGRAAGMTSMDPFSSPEGTRSSYWFGAQASESALPFKALLGSPSSSAGRKVGQIKSLRDYQNENQGLASSGNRGAASFLRETVPVDSASAVNAAGLRESASFDALIDPVNEYADPTRQALDPVVGQTTRFHAGPGADGFDAIRSTMASPRNTSLSRMRGELESGLSRPSVAGVESMINGPRKIPAIESTPIRISRPKASF